MRQEGLIKFACCSNEKLQTENPYADVEGIQLKQRRSLKSSITESWGMGRSPADVQDDCKVDFLNRQERQEKDEFGGETAISLFFVPWRFFYDFQKFQIRAEIDRPK